MTLREAKNIMARNGYRLVRESKSKEPKMFLTWSYIGDEPCDNKDNWIYIDGNITTAKEQIKKAMEEDGYRVETVEYKKYGVSSIHNFYAYAYDDKGKLFQAREYRLFWDKGKKEKYEIKGQELLDIVDEKGIVSGEDWYWALCTISYWDYNLSEDGFLDGPYAKEDADEADIGYYWSEGFNTKSKYVLIYADQVFNVNKAKDLLKKFTMEEVIDIVEKKDFSCM